MTVDEVDRATMAALLLRENDAEEALERARQEVRLWVKRGRLALKHGERELAAQAKARAAEAKARFLGAQAELDSIAAQKHGLRREARRPEGDESMRAEMLVEHFRLQGLDPTEQETAEIARRVEAGERVDALRRQMAGEPAESEPAAAGPPPAAAELPPTTAEPPPTAAESTGVDRELDRLRAEPPSQAEPAISEDEIAALERELAALREEEAKATADATAESAEPGKGRKGTTEDPEDTGGD